MTLQDSYAALSNVAVFSRNVGNLTSSTVPTPLASVAHRSRQYYRRKVLSTRLQHFDRSKHLDGRKVRAEEFLTQALHYDCILSTLASKPLSDCSQSTLLLRFHLGSECVSRAPYLDRGKILYFFIQKHTRI